MKKVFIRREFEGQKAVAVLVNGEKKYIPVEREVEVPDTFAEVIENAKRAKEQELEFRLKEQLKGARASGLVK